MADTKLSALTELAAAPAVDDELYIRDVSEAASAESKRLTMTNLFNTPTILTPVINGAVTTTGLEIPTFTELGNIAYSSSMYIYATADNLFTGYFGGGSGGGRGSILILSGADHAWTGRLELRTPNAAKNADVIRLSLAGGIDTAIATWSAINQIFGASYLQVTEMTAPGAGAANTARIYAVVDGGTLTDLAAVFQDGTVDIFAQEATPLNSPIFTEPDKTEIKMVQLKPHPGIIQFAVKYPDGRTHILKEIQYHNEDKINANKGAKDKLPADWEVETTAEMGVRLAKLEQDRLDAIEAAKNVVLPQAEENK